MGNENSGGWQNDEALPLYTFRAHVAEGNEAIEIPAELQRQLGEFIRRAGTRRLELVVKEDTPRRPDLAQAYERGEQAVAEILKSSGMLTGEAMGERLGMSRAAVNDKRRRRQVLGLEGPKRGYRYPDWQVREDGRLVEGLEALFERLGDDPWTVYRFLTTPSEALDGEPPKARLRRSEVKAVLRAADSFAEGNYT